jgi:hypothetical protein
MTVQKKSDQNQKNTRPEPANLVRRYGQIGIAALAAVLQYSTSVKKPTATTARYDERFVEHTV